MPLYRPSSLAISTGMCTTFGGVVGSATISLLFCALAAPGSVSAAAASSRQCRIKFAHVILPDVFLKPTEAPHSIGPIAAFPLEAAILPDHGCKNNEAGDGTTNTGRVIRR